MPYQWYNTPNIHWCTLRDIDRLCAKNNIRVLERAVMTGSKHVDTLPNLCCAASRFTAWGENVKTRPSEKTF